MKTTIKRILSLSLALVMLLALSVFSFAAEEDYDFTLTLVHTNDIHGHVDVIPYAKGLVDKLKADGENVLLIDAGDALAGTTFTSYDNGLSMITAMNMAKYDLFALGNHEQYMALADYTAAAEASEFPHLGANVTDEFRAAGDVQDYVIQEIEGVKIAFIGLTVGTYSIEGGEAAVASAQAAKTAAEAEGATVFIGVFHLGVTDADTSKRSTYVAQNCPWLTLIIDAHCHSAHANGIYEGDVLIAETGEYGNNIGVIELAFKDGAVVSREAYLVGVTQDTQAAVRYTVDELGIVPDAEITAFIAGVNEQLAYLQEVVATIPVHLDGERVDSRARETNLGDLMADAMLYVSDADVAIMPSVFIRSSIEAGELTREKFLDLFLKAETDVYYMTVNGTQLKEILELMLDGVPEVSGNFNQIGGVRLVYDEEREIGDRIISLTMSDGTAVSAEESYKLIVSDKTFSDYYGSDWAESFTDYELAEFTANDAFLTYINSGDVPSWDVDGRIASVNAATDEQAAEESVPVETETEAAEIPEVTAPAEEHSEDTSAATQSSYVVQSGDTLWKIAQKLYGTGTKWTVIYEANQDRISNPNRIYIGQELVIPA